MFKSCSRHREEISRCERSSVVEHHLAKVGVAGSNPVVRLRRRRGGGTGRRTGLKILRWQHRTGSIPVLGIYDRAPLAQLDRVPDYESGG